MASDLSGVLEPGDPVRVATGFVFTEGPLWHPDGFLYVSDINAATHYRVSLPNGEKTVIRRDSGGANGATFDLQGRLVMCEQYGRRLVRTEPDGELTTLADRYEGKRLNGTNDVVRRSDGSLYFTDPERLIPEPERELGHSAIFRYMPDGELRLMTSEMNHPNGLAFSPDETKLYASNTRPNPHLYVFDVSPDGALADGRLFAEMPYGPAEPGATFTTSAGLIRPMAEKGGVPDGLKVDVEGRIFCTGPGGTWVWEAGGTHLGIIRTPELPANVAFGDVDSRSLYMTCRTSVYMLRTRTPGIAATPPPA